MTNRPKATGTLAESAVVKVLRAAGVQCERVALHGGKDVGDIHAHGGRVVVEVKSRKTWPSARQVEAWLEEACAEGDRVPHCDVAALVVKRPGCGPANAGDWLAVMRVEDFLWLATQDADVLPVVRRHPVTLPLATFADLVAHLPKEPTA